MTHPVPGTVPAQPLRLHPQTAPAADGAGTQRRPPAAVEALLDLLRRLGLKARSA